jgi:diadenosine tetraphosphate (Ap4A) HIT family hydrolase
MPEYSTPDCIFCKIVAGEMPSHQVWSSDTHLAFLSIFPNTPGVTVVIPKTHYSSYLFDQSDQVVADQILASKEVARLIDSAFADVGRCGIVFEGFGVDHLHTKLFPLHGTANLEKWQPIESGIKRDYFVQYPGYISSNDSDRAEDAELAKIAAQIRAASQD